MLSEQRVTGRGVAGGGQLPLLNFALPENCRKFFFLSENYRPRAQNLGLKTTRFEGQFRGKIEILSTHNLLPGQKFAAVCRKIETSCLAYF